MKYRKIQHTNLNVSVIGIGTHQLSGEWGETFCEKRVAELLNRARQLGINFIDTAECYGDHLAERLIGQAVHGCRKDWIIGTKFGHKFLAPFQIETRFTPRQVIRQLEDSLKALGTDYIDVYYFHSGNNTEFECVELWDALAKAVTAGKIRHLGLSIANDCVMKDDLLQLENALTFGIHIVQVVYNCLNKKPEERLFPLCMQRGIGVVGRIPLARGLLGGKYSPGSTFAAGDIRGGKNEALSQSYLEKVEAIKKDVPRGANMAQWALAWCLKHPAVSCVIPGARNLAQLEMNAGTAGWMEGRHPLDLELVP